MRFFVTISIVLLPLLGISQLITNTGMTVQNLVQNVFAGNGVTISNIQFSGGNAAIGYFTANNTNLGLSEGIVMTTGTVLNTGSGPHGPNNQPAAGMDNGAGGYQALSNLINGIPTYNASILEFDFTTCSDKVQFNYVFGSEEYLEYVGSEYNDVFAFFISGPGLGTQNIAKLPNGQVVAINNVHAAASNQFGNFGPVNAQYYVNNANGGTIQYDGFTKVLTAEANVQCNATYHLVLAIADAGDAIFDSGIFLEANSFTVNTPVTISHELSLNAFNNPNIMAESCASTTVTLDRIDCNIGIPMTIPITVSGTATEGVDYSNIPNSVTFPPGASTIDFTIDAFQDGLTEGQESLTLTFNIEDNCGNLSSQTLDLFINDVDPVDVEITGGTISCPGETIELVATASGGGAPYSYSWSTGETTPSIFVAPTSTQTYSVTVTDDCLNESASASIQVDVPIIPPLVIDATPDITEICPYIPAELEAIASGGTPPYTYQWSSPGNPNLGTASTYTAIPSTTTTYTVTVTDYCGMTTSESIVYTITSPPLVLTMSPDIEICPGDSALISVSATGGYGMHYFNWLHSGETTSEVWVHPDRTTTYTVSVSDECQTFTVEGSVTVVVVKPTADFIALSSTFFNGMPVTFENTSINAVTYEWDFGDGNSSTLVHPSNTYDLPGMYEIMLIAIDEKGCRDTIVKPINIEEEWWIYVPNTFTPDGNRFNNDFRVSTIGIKELNVQIFNRWGELIFTENNVNFIWDGTHKGFYVPDGTYTYKIEFLTNSGREKNIHGHINVLK